MKVWLLLSRLEHGGLERVQLNIANAMHGKGIHVAIVAGQVIADVKQELPDSLPVLELAKRGARHFPLALVRALRHFKPDVVFTTSNDVACLLLMLRPLFFRDTRVIVTQHLSLSAPRRHAHGLKRVKLEIIRFLMRHLLPAADSIVAVSQGVAYDMEQEVLPAKIHTRVIYNPIVAPDFEERTGQTAIWPWPDRDLPTIIFVGRLSSVKRLDLLLGSFRSLVRSIPSRLLIVGTGPLRQELEQRVQNEGIDQYCRLTGFVENPLPLISASDVLVLASDYEGFGNVLVEAMACGTQVIATDCPHGPAEILANGQFGQLIPTNNASALETALRLSLQGVVHFPSAALKARAQDFTVQKAAQQYMQLLAPKVDSA